MRTAFTLAALIVLAACSTVPTKPFTPAAAPAGAAAVYFYRPPEMTGSLLKPTILANGAELGRLGYGSYGLAQLPPGQTTLRSKWPGIPGTRRDDEVTLTLEAGKVYYLRVQAHGLTPSIPHIGGLQFENRQGLETVEQADAVKQLAGMKEIALEK